MKYYINNTAIDTREQLREAVVALQSEAKTVYDLLTIDKESEEQFTADLLGDLTTIGADWGHSFDANILREAVSKDKCTIKEVFEELNEHEECDGPLDLALNNHNSRLCGDYVTAIECAHENGWDDLVEQMIGEDYTYGDLKDDFNSNIYGSWAIDYIIVPAC